MVEKLTPADAKEYLNKYKWHFERVHADELRVLDTVTLKQHTRENSVARLYLDNKYRLPLNTHVYFNLITFLEQNGRAGGDTIIKILQSHCEVKQTERGPIDQFSFEAIITRARGSDPAELGDMEEGIPGGFTGVSNHDILNNNAPIRLGPQQTELELSQDVRAELQDEDLRNPPEPGQTTLVEAYDLKIKREESVDAIPRNEIPYPPSRARDVVMEVQKIKENRDRFKIEGRTGGVGPAVSVCMFTFHNTMDAYVPDTYTM
jgi:transcription initiation factor TFIID subunit 5